jgi:hypothetical protein
VAELGETMSLSEYTEWQDFYRTEPFLAERVDLAGALVASIIVNVNRGKGSKMASVDDFMLVANGLKSARVANDDDGSAHLRSFILSMGGSVS